MAIGLGGTYFDLFLGQKRVPLESMRFAGLVISSHVLYKQPIGHIKFVDSIGLMKGFKIEDGMDIFFKLGKTTNRVFLYTYRLFNCKQEKVGQDDVEYTLSFIDVGDIWRLQAAKASIEGSSNEALEKIAKYCKFDYKGVETSDKQVWLPMAESFSQFAHRICTNGFVDETSCMMVSVNMYGEMRYRNINGMDISQAKKFRYGSEQPGAIWVTDIAFKQDSGTANQLGGYKQTNHQFNIKGDKRVKSSKTKTRRLTQSSNINEKVHGSVGDGKIKVMPVDSGNNHDNTLKARNQNARVPLLLSTSVSLLTPFDPDLELLEPCFLEYYQKGKLQEEESGLYIVAGKAIVLSPDLQYYERYQIIRDGSNKKGGTK